MKRLICIAIVLFAAISAFAQNHITVNDPSGFWSNVHSSITLDTSNATIVPFPLILPDNATFSTSVTVNGTFTKDVGDFRTGNFWNIDFIFYPPNNTPTTGTFANKVGVNEVVEVDNHVSGQAVCSAGLFSPQESFTVTKLTLVPDPAHGTNIVTELSATFTKFCAKSDGSNAKITGEVVYSSSATGGGGTPPGGGGTPTPTPTPAPPPTTPVIIFPDTFFDNPVSLGNADSVQIPFSVFVPQDFNKDVTLSASSSPDGLGLTFDKNTLAAPGSGDAVLTISSGPDTFPIDRQVAITTTFIDENGNPVTSTATFPVSLVCDPPKIFGTNQPRDSHSATVAVTANGSGPFRYQWFAGSTGQTHFPISGATDRTLTLPAVTGETPFWVRVSNACGSVDSNTVIVTPR